MKKFLGVSALALTAISGAAHAADAPMMPQNQWFINAGITGIFFQPSLTSASSPVITGASVTNNVTGTLEIGRYLNDNISLSLWAGIPPTNDFMLTTATPFGTVKVGSATYGSVMLGAQYHFMPHGGIDPYVGAGAAYNITLSTNPNGAATPGGGFTALTIDNALVPFLEAGVKAPVADRISLFVDVRKEFFTAHATATNAALGGAAQAYAALDPWIVSAGVGFSF